MVKKIQKRIVENQFLLLVLVGGIVFFTLTDNWGLYLEPMRNFGKVCWKALGVDLFQEEIAELFQEDTQEDLTGRIDSVNEEQEVSEEPVEEIGVQETVQEILEPEETESGPVWTTVEDDYFDDALFIGDSRVVGLQDYGKMEDRATFFASTGLNIFKLLSAKIAQLPDQIMKVSVEEALEQKQFGKIYLMVGINELDIGTVERFENTYRETVNRIRELQPDAIIYIQSILKVTQKRSDKGDYIQNEGIDARNDAIMNIADNEHVFYLNVNEVVCDESGCLNPEYTSDGVHLKVKYIPLWKEYLKNHAIQ